ncbi:MAG TPA: CGNR zinc finger domain-containing protein [Euzebyales bacterium]|nr:CGNR zinc finger domain-containing protein [Euzebyales bacterium]
MNYDHYDDPSVELAVNLINGYAAPVRAAAGEADAPLPDLSDFLRHHGCDPQDGSPDEIAALQRLAERLHGVFTADDTADAVAIVNDLLVRSGALPQISGHDDEDWHLHYYPAGTGLVDRLAVTAAMGLATVLCTAGGRRLGRCGGTACADVYVDTSRNNRRRFCSDGCANRSHVAAHRARQRADHA